jgi:hypothetical protein
MRTHYTKQEEAGKENTTGSRGAGDQKKAEDKTLEETMKGLNWGSALKITAMVAGAVVALGGAGFGGYKYGMKKGASMAPQQA